MSSSWHHANRTSEWIVIDVGRLFIVRNDFEGQVIVGRVFGPESAHTKTQRLLSQVEFTNGRWRRFEGLDQTIQHVDKETKQLNGLFHLGLIHQLHRRLIEFGHLFGWTLNSLPRRLLLATGAAGVSRRWRMLRQTWALAALRTAARKDRLQRRHAVVSRPVGSTRTAATLKPVASFQRPLTVRFGLVREYRPCTVRVKVRHKSLIKWIRFIHNISSYRSFRTRVDLDWLVVKRW